MWFVRFQILIRALQSIWIKLLVMSWLYYILAPSDFQTFLRPCPIYVHRRYTSTRIFWHFFFMFFSFFYSWKLSVKWPHQFPLLYVWQQQNRVTEASYSDHSDVQWYSFGFVFFQSWISNTKFEPMQCERRITHGPLHESHQYLSRVLTPVAGLLRYVSGKLPTSSKMKKSVFSNKTYLCSLCPGDFWNWNFLRKNLKCIHF